jgi:3-hydroxy-3-methylglutaryl CoA synthase
MIGITRYGAYVPRLRLDRRAIVQSNAWYQPGLKAKGHRAMGNWDEDSLTMAVEAARDALGGADDRGYLRSLYLASTTFPFADRLSSVVAKEALTLDDDVAALDVGGSCRAGLSALHQALLSAAAGRGAALVAAADRRKTMLASTQELDFGDAAAAITVGDADVIAEFLGAGVVSEDFVDHFRGAGSDFDYTWEERWIREEGIAKLVPRAVRAALERAGVPGDQVDHLIFPTTIRGVEKKLAADCGVAPQKFCSNLAEEVGDSGAAHALLVLADTLQRAQPGQVIVVAQFGQGAEALVFRTTEALSGFSPREGVAGWIGKGAVETNYTKLLAFNGLVPVEKGMRGEQDKKTALTTLYRNKSMILGLVGGRCKVTGTVQFPPSRISVTPGQPEQDTQEPYKLAERLASVVSWSADYLSYCPAPPNHYGYMNFEGGGRCYLEITDVAPNEVDTGMRMRMSFRIKDLDERRDFKRYFWKAVPVRDAKSAN